MKKTLHFLKFSVLITACSLVLNTGWAEAQTEITVEPGFNTLLDAVIANPGATFILQRGGDYVVDQQIEITVPTIIKGETEPVATKPAVLSYFANPGDAPGKSLIAIAANCTLQNFGIMGFTFDEQQIGPNILVTTGDISITIDGCVFQGSTQVLETNANNNLVIIEKNNKFFNLVTTGWDNWGGFSTLWGGDSADFKCYNNTYFSSGRVFNNGGAGPNGKEVMDHNTYCNTWGDTYFPAYDKELSYTNNIFFNSQIRGYIGVRKDANGDTTWVGDYSDWSGTGITDTLCGDISIFPHAADSTHDRPVFILNNLKMNDNTLLDFYAENNITAQTLFNVTGYKYAERFGWTIENNILQEEGNAVDPQFAMGAITEDVFHWMFMQRKERHLPAADRGENFPYACGWWPNTESKGTFIWPLPFDLKPLNTEIWDAGDDGYPLGDLNWFGPEVVEAWENGDPSPVVIETGIKNITSSDLNLRNYPNPFSGSTRISYSVPLQAKVTLKVYNVTGAEVATLVDAMQSAGDHEVTFNGANLKNGMYYCKLQVGIISQVHKLTLIK